MRPRFFATLVAQASRVVCTVLAVVMVGAIVPTLSSQPARATGGGSGSVDGDTITAEVRYDSPPVTSGCTWERVRGTPSLPVAGTSPVVTETLYYRVCGDRVMSYQWIRDSTPRRIAESANSKVSRLVNALALRTAPPSDRLVVKVGTWFWVPRAAWKPISVTAWIPTQAGPIAVTTTATPRTLTYFPGDGNRAVSCTGPGRAWTPRDGDKASSQCMYTYPRASHRMANRRYTAKMSVTWTVTWRSSLGIGGPLPPITTGATMPVRVLELHALSR